MEEEKKDKEEDKEEEEEKPEEEVKREERKDQALRVDEYYPEGHREGAVSESPLPTSLASYYDLFGQESFRRYNLHYVAKDTLLFITGNSYQIYNTQTREREVLFGKDGGGIGSIAVHPSKGFYAVAEKGENPNIYVYEYPSKKLYRVLRKGTINYYSSIDFSPSGERLASVGGDPDYQLSIWDWRQEKLMLKAKAFSQEVFRCAFSPYSDYSLITSGTGHIRFWKISQTFTGLKLQSEIGKFGQLELSDVSAFVELSNGLVLCGTEYGTLLLWDGNLVKAHIKLEGDVPVHEGMIEQIMIKDNYVVTAGSDGYAKWFDLNFIANEEPDESLNLVVKVLYSFQIKSKELGGGNLPVQTVPAHIVSILQGSDHWMVGDGQGKIWRFNPENKEIEEVLKFHSGRVSDLAMSTETNAAVSIGVDGCVKLFDFVKRREVYSRQFQEGGLCLDFLPKTLRNQGRVLAAGFAGGVVRVLLLTDSAFQLLAAFKALDEDIVKVGYAPDGSGFVAAGANGGLFFFEITDKDLQRYDPVCMVGLKQRITDMKWHRYSKQILVACETGNVFEVMRPEKEKVDTESTYLVTLPMRKWTLRMMECQMKKYHQKDETEEEKRIRRIKMYTGKLEDLKEEEEKEWEPAPILSISYMSSDANTFLLSASQQFKGKLYVCQFDSDRPVQYIDYEYRNVSCNSISYSLEDDLLLVGLSNGRYQVRHSKKLEKYLEVNAHDYYLGKLRRVVVSYKKSFVLSTGDDGLIFAFKINKDAIAKLGHYYHDTAEEEQSEAEVKALAATEAAADAETVELLELGKSVAVTGEINIDIDPKQVMSFQEEKLKSEEDIKQRQAERKKQTTKESVQQLREEYEKILRTNLKDTKLDVPKEYYEVINIDQEINSEITDVVKELEYNQELHQVAVEKLRAKYLDPLEYNTIMVKGIKSQAFVKTFRLPKLPEFVEEGIREQEELARLENLKKEKLDTSDESIESSVKGGASPMMGTQSLLKSKGATFHIEPMKGKEIKKSTAEVNQEKRRQKRMEKKEEKERIKKAEPKDEDDPTYKKKMEKIIVNKGDKKLKSDENYDVPEEQRRDAKKQRYEMILVERGLHNIQKDLNDQILAQRERKVGIVSKAKRINDRIREINKVLEVEEGLFQPSIDEAQEFPEKFTEVKNECLVEHLQREKERREQEEKKSDFYAAHKDSEEEEKGQEDFYDAYLIDRPREEKEPALEDSLLPPDRKDFNKEKSKVEAEQDEIQKIELSYEKECLLDELNKEIADFDQKLGELQLNKMKLESDKKYGQMKMIIGYESLNMLKGLVDRDAELTERLSKCKQEKVVIATQFKEIASKMRDKDEIMNRLKEEKEQIMSKFDELVPLNHVEREKLYDFFMRKIKRKTKAPEEEKGDDLEGKEKDDDEIEEESEDEDDKDAWDEDDDAKDQPGGPNKEQYQIDQIIEERTKKLDLEEKLKKMAKENTELQKKSFELERQKNRIDQEERLIEEEIKLFQREKMKRLNKMEQSFVLRMSQVENLEEDARNEKRERIEAMRERRRNEVDRRESETRKNEMGELEEDEPGAQDEEPFDNLQACIGFILPPDLKDSLLFTQEEINGLKRNIQQHRAKLEKETRNQKEKKLENEKLIKMKQRREKEKKTEEQIFEDELQLKFGSIIKLDEEIPWTSNTENIKKKEAEFSKVEKLQNAKIKGAEEELEAKKRELSDQVKRNTDLLKHIKQLGETNTSLQKRLKNVNEQLYKYDNTEEKNKLLREKNEIERKLNIQNQKIDIIRKEIELFRRKGGHIYTTITANRRIAGMPQGDAQPPPQPA